MAVKTSNEATSSTIKEFRNFTGVIPYKVVAINPSLMELTTLGVNYLKNEPVYLKSFENNGNKSEKVQIDFWVKSLDSKEVPEGLDLTVPLSFLIDKESWIGQNTGKSQFVNKYGRTAWGNSIEDLNNNEYFINEGTRVAHKGEEELYKFLFAWLNMTYDTKNKVYDECILDIDKIVNGDFSELRSLVSIGKPYVVKVLTGLRPSEQEDGTVRYFPILYNKYFLKHNQTKTDALQNFVNKDDYTSFSTEKRPVIYTYDITEYSKPSPDTTEKPKQESPF